MLENSVVAWIWCIVCSNLLKTTVWIVMKSHAQMGLELRTSSIGCQHGHYRELRGPGDQVSHLDTWWWNIYLKHVFLLQLEGLKSEYESQVNSLRDELSRQGHGEISEQSVRDIFQQVNIEDIQDVKDFGTLMIWKRCLSLVIVK